MENQGQLYFGLFLTSDTLLMAIYLLSGFLALAIIISMMRIYKKCGKPAISAIVPIWGQIVLFQIADIEWWYIFIPIVNFVMMIKAYINLAKKFGKGSGFAIGIIFLPMIFIPLLSFYDCVSESKKEVNETIYNPFNQTNVESIMPEAPIAPVSPTIVEIPVEPITPTFEENVSIAPVIEEQPVVSNEITNISTNEDIISNDPINVVEPIMEIPEIENNITNNLESPIMSVPTNNEEISDVPINVQEQIIPIVEENVSIAPVVEEQPVVSNEINNISTNEDIILNNTNSVVNPVMEIPEIENNITNNLESPVMLVPTNNEEVSDVPINVQEPTNTTVEDIQNALNIKDVQLEENTNVSQEGLVEDLEIPEIATKVCPACGVAISGDNKFCTSCGSQL